MNMQNKLYSTWGELGLNFSGFILATGSVAILLPYSVITQNGLIFLCAVILACAGVRLLWQAKVRKGLRINGESNLIDKNATTSEKKQKRVSATLIVGGIVLSLSSSVFLLSSGQSVITLLVGGLIAVAIGLRMAQVEAQQPSTRE